MPKIASGNFTPHFVSRAYLLQALVRDNWRCVATGLIDSNVPEDPPPEFAIHTECAHIIPEATFFGVNPKSEQNPTVHRCGYFVLCRATHLHAQLDYSASILVVLSRFRYDISSFNGEKVHSLTNVMTMQRDMHDAFDRLKFYLEATVSFDIAMYSLNKLGTVSL